ncbi:MAG: tetratricopeptide repeat protein, partial [Paludibacteraceae bacterium]|nr:tetratricopeptide repeat protein [Paludibacteraceae bacterium]
AKNDERKNISGIEVWGYASPDGSVELNEKLSEQREANASKFIAQKVKKNKVQAGIDTKTTAEDWEGFQQLMEASNMQDKDLVLRVLSMYSDPEEREAHIKNLSSVYENIAEDILPQLRRARITMTTELTGKTDDEISKLAKEDASQLNVEELLYAATLTGDNAEKAAIYEQCIKQFPNDYRAYNNLGLMKAAEGNYSAASEFYEKALKIDANNADVNYNAGIAAMAQGKLDDAQAYFGKAAGTTGDLNSALGTLYTMKGDYKNASKSFGSAVSNNAAIQQILNGDYATARTTLNSVKNPNSTTYYMQAVVGARTNDREAVLSNLKTAIAKDSGVKELVQNDIEFTAFAQDADFQALIK